MIQAGAGFSSITRPFVDKLLVNQGPRWRRNQPRVGKSQESPNRRNRKVTEARRYEHGGLVGWDFVDGDNLGSLFISGVTRGLKGIKSGYWGEPHV